PAMAAANDPNMRGRRAEVDKMFDQAIGRYQRLLTKYPEFTYANLARYGLATAQYQRGLYADAIQTLSMILDADRSGDLAPVNYLLADCNIRLFPPETVDAMQAAQMIERAEQAAKLLEKYIAAQPKGPQAPDALLKLGYCCQRMGMLLADPAEKQKTLTQARQVYERLFQEFGTSPAMPPAVMERARCMALMGDPNGAINELNRFNADPLRQSPVAPLAITRLASLLRAQNRAPEAVNFMAQWRQQEGALQNDPERSQWIPLLQYEHALAVKESGKLPEARAIFEATAKQFAARPEAADALWRAGQCRREELLATLAAARAVPLKPGVRPDEIAAATKSIEDGLAVLRQTAEYFKTEAAKLKPAGGAGASPARAPAASEACLRMLYEAAWCCRALADAEIEVARQKLQRQGMDKVLANLKKTNQPVTVLNPPEVAAAAVPPQPSEKGAREQYTALIALTSRSPLGSRVRLELAEMDAGRGQNDSALELLAAALEDNPPAELAERLHLRIATCLLAKNDTKGALAQAQAVTKNAASPLAGEARLLTGEVFIQSKDWPNAIAQLVPFRDQDPWRNMPGLAERGLLRLGYACSQVQRWDESRQAMDILIQRFPQSPWIYEARYGIGWAWQNVNQHENACNAYLEVTRGTASEVAARAQLQMGLCRLAQKRFPEAAKELLAVHYTYDYPEHSAAALCEAGQAHLEQKQPAEAARLWQSVIKDFAGSKWAETAKQRLAALK
ncbi:MAG: tetratricopeptide repeat protein, partial [Planctomycetota bacterium]|nr:tetratricopeptide repeat protein [Planctomycetota bacterium]